MEYGYNVINIVQSGDPGAAVPLDGIGKGTEVANISFIGYDGTVFDGQGTQSMHSQLSPIYRTPGVDS